MRDIDIVFNFLKETDKKHNAVCYITFERLRYYHGDMEARVPVFGFELEKLLRDELGKISNLKFESVEGDSRYFGRHIGMAAADSAEDLDSTIRELERIALINPFSKENFEKAEAYREKCKNEYKLNGSAELPSLREELVLFYQAVNYFRTDDRLEEVGPFARAIMYIKRPIILEQNPGRILEQLKEYCKGRREFDENDYFPYAKDINVDELNLDMSRKIFKGPFKKALMPVGD